MKKNKKLKNNCFIKIAEGASLLARYYEFDHEKKYINPKGSYWMCELWLNENRVTNIQAYDSKAKRKMNRAWLRKRMRDLLDSISPKWEIVKK